MNADKLRGIIKEQRLTIEKVASSIGINTATLSRKLNGESEFTRDEICNLRTVLALEDDDLMAIFFSEA